MRRKLSRGGEQRRLIRRVYEETESLSMLGAKDKERGDLRVRIKDQCTISLQLTIL